MIEYNFGERKCKLSWIDFLCLETISPVSKLYKKDFKDFYALYEFIELYKNKISHILFDGYEYFLEHGRLHNLYGPAYIRYDEGGYFPGPKPWFYIDGKMVSDDHNALEKGCRKLEDFQKKEIFHFKELTGKINSRDQTTGIMYRRTEGIDYNIFPIDLKNRIKLDVRKKKLIQLNDSR